MRFGGRRTSDNVEFREGGGGGFHFGGGGGGGAMLLGLDDAPGTAADGVAKILCPAVERTSVRAQAHA